MTSKKIIYSASALILDKSSSAPKILLIKREKDPSKGLWTFPGGRIEKDERIKDAIMRESKEETGLMFYEPKSEFMAFSESFFGSKVIFM